MKCLKIKRGSLGFRIESAFTLKDLNGLMEHLYGAENLYQCPALAWRSTLRRLSLVCWPTSSVGFDRPFTHKHIKKVIFWWLTRSSPFFAVGRRGDALARAGFFVTSLSTLFRSATFNWQWFGRILLKQRSTPCAYINTVFYISLFYVCPIYTTGVMWPDAVYFMHCCVDHFLRIKLFQVHITDMKMNLSCCFWGA